MFTINSIIDSLPADNSTNALYIGNVASPMSASDIKRLVPKATSWTFESSVRRTDFVAFFAARKDARQSMRQLQGLSYLGKHLIIEYASVQLGRKKEIMARTAAFPELYYSLPEESGVAERLSEARKMVTQLSASPPSASRWVDFR